MIPKREPNSGEKYKSGMKILTVDVAPHTEKMARQIRGNLTRMPTLRPDPAG